MANRRKAEAHQYTDELQANPEWQKYWAEQMAAQQRGIDRYGTKNFTQDALRAYYQPQWRAEAERILGRPLPHDYEFNMVGSLNGRPDELLTRRGFIDRNPWFMPAMAATAGVAGPLLGGALGGGAGAGAGGASATPALSSLPVTAANPTAGVLGTAGSIMAKTAGGLGKFMNSPLGLSLLGMGTDILGGLIGGDDEKGDQRHSFSDLPNSDPRKAVVDPVNNMYNAIRTMNQMAQAQAQRSANPVQLRSTSMPGFGGRGTASVPVGGRFQPQGLDMSGLLGELQAQMGPRRQLPGEQPVQRRSVWNPMGNK